MIVFDLKCGSGHVFEAWFGSSRDYDGQRERGLVSCPICGADDVAKAVMAPAVGAKGNRAPDPVSGSLPMAHGGQPGPAEMKQILAKLADAQAKALEKSDYVGTRFAEEARAMHEGDTDERQIHGEATLDEAKSLLDDGVPVAPLPFPVRRPHSDN